MNDLIHSTILVTGAGGQLGRQVVDLLRQAGATKVIAGSRDPSKLSIPGVDVRRIDFADAASLEIGFAGVDQVLIISTDVVGEVRQKLQLAAVEAAAKAGVKHIAYTSLSNPGPESPVLIAPDHRVTEEAIKATSVPYTFLRNSIYTDMLLQSLPSVLASGQWFTAAGDGRIAHVTREDCARAAVAVLLAGPQGVVEVAGPEPLSMEQIAAIASEVFGTPITVVKVSAEALAGGMTSAGLPAEVAALLASFETATSLGRHDVQSDVERLTGTPPTGLATFLEANRGAVGH